jgi:hypothetical protein
VCVLGKKKYNVTARDGTRQICFAGAIQSILLPLRPRAPISGRLVANMLEAAGVTRLMVMDLHAAQIQGVPHHFRGGKTPARENLLREKFCPKFRDSIFTRGFQPEDRNFPAVSFLFFSFLFFSFFFFFFFLRKVQFRQTP